MIFSSLLFVSMTCFSQLESKKELGLLGKVKSFILSENKAVDKLGKIEKDNSENSFKNDVEEFREFDIYGRCVSFEYSKDSIYEKLKFKYDDKNMLIEEIDYPILSKTGNITKYRYKYDIHKKIVEKNTYNNDILSLKETYKYNEKGYEIENVSYLLDVGWDEPEIISKYIKKYDAEGNIKEEISSEIGGVITEKKIFQYHKNSNEKIVTINIFGIDDTLESINIKVYNLNNILIRSEELNAKNTLISKNVYDDKGLLVKSFFYDEVGREEFYYYNSNQKLTSVLTYDLNHNLINKLIMDYNSKDDILFNKVLNSNDEVISEIRYQYDYDIKGNWIKIVEYKNEFPKTIKVRKIIYFQ